MEINGKIITITQPRSINTKNGLSNVYGFVIQTEGEYPRKVMFEVMGDDRWSKMNLAVGMDCSVSFDIASREWQGKWFTQATAWRVQALNAAQPQYHQQAMPRPQAQPQGDNSIPF